MYISDQFIYAEIRDFISYRLLGCILIEIRIWMSTLFEYTSVNYVNA